MEVDVLRAIALWPVEQLWAQLAVSTGSRYFWPFILGGLVIAWVAARAGRASLYADAGRLGYWLGASARVDYAFVVFNPLIKFIFFSSLLMALASFGDGLIAAQPADEMAWVWAAALTLTLFLADDFMRFFGHWLMHRVPVMWSFHRVHHAAESMTFATADRHHFMETVFFTVPLVATAALVNAAFIVLTGIETQPYALAGSNILLVGFNLVAGAFRHGPIWISFGPRLERWFISPAMHQIHHSVRQEHFDKNMGGTLAIWDRLFGTHHSPTGVEELCEGIGLGEDGKPLNTIPGAVLEPFGHAARTLIGRSRRISEHHA
ncbi:MAG: sterol desaturase family protein [Pseudomonadota bacterium]